MGGGGGGGGGDGSGGRRRIKGKEGIVFKDQFFSFLNILSGGRIWPAGPAVT